MRVPRLVVALLAFSLVLAGVIVPAAGASDGTTTDNSSDAGPIDRPYPHTVLTIDVGGDGDARWTVTSRFVVETEHERAAFEELSESVENDSSDVGYSTETFRRAASLAAEASGREMAIRNDTWTSEVTNGTGSLSLRFTWTNFAAVEGERIVIEDAFSTEDGTWFPSLADGQRLVINPPPGYAPINTPPDRGPVNGSLIWTGPREFDPGYFSIVYVPSRPATTTTTTTLTTTDPGPARGTSPLFWLGVGLLVVAVGAGGYYYAVQQRRPGPTAGGSAEAAVEGESGKTAPADEADTDTEATAEETEASPQPVSGNEDGSGAAAVDVDGAKLTDDDGRGIDPELLSDEERVERLLERNGGRMKQADIVTETGWSNAKVSQLLSSMAEEDRINKLRIGRENLITLPDEDVTDFGK